jgi:VanZ family protein
MSKIHTIIARDRATLFRVLLVVALLAIFFLATTRLSIPVAEDMNDTVGHVIAFFVLALLVDLSFPAWTFRTKVVVLIVYGLSIEIAQAYLPYRSCSLFDLGADAGGLALYGICQPALRYCSFFGKGLEGNNRAEK